MLNIIIPMAGLGNRFKSAGYLEPKPLIEVFKTPMVKVVIDNLRPQKPYKFIFLCQESHLVDYDLYKQLKTWEPSCEVISVSSVTEGAACTVLLAQEKIDNDTPLLIVNCDQYIDFDINTFLGHAFVHDGCIMTMKANHNKWSYVKLGSEGFVTEVAEKRVISDEATVGIYSFTKGKDFIRAAKLMIADDVRVNGEFYVAPVYNVFIREQKKIAIYNIGHEGEKMYGLGTPEDLKLFLNTSHAKQFQKVT